MTKLEIIIKEARGTKLADRFGNLAFGYVVGSRDFFQVDSALSSATQQAETQRVGHNPN